MSWHLAAMPLVVGVIGIVVMIDVGAGLDLIAFQAVATGGLTIMLGMLTR
jgi:hypothetical protein